jgi:hypothetical protein
MTKAQSFSAAFSNHTQDSCQLLDARIASREHTRVLKERPNVHSANRKRLYRSNVLSVLRQACDIPADRDELVRRFMRMANTLEHARAIAIKDTADSDLQEDDATPKERWHETLGGDVHGYRSLAQHRELLRQDAIKEHLFHPLLVALLAFQVGGPVNAANTATAHRWTLQPDQSTSAVHVQNFLMQGDDQDFFDDHRVTLVWEEREGEEATSMGNHHIFHSGDATPRRLATARVAGGDHGNATHKNAPTTIVYNSENTALVYECQDPAVIRHSINLDFHLNTMGEQLVRLFNPLELSEIQAAELTLGDLLTNFAIPNYQQHFHRLLFSPDSLQAIVRRLSRLDVPTLDLSIPSEQGKLNKRLNAYKQENHAHIPRSVRSMENDISISRSFQSAASFLENLRFKAQRDVHLPIGMDLFPYDLLDEDREWARKFLRDAVGEIIARRFTEYTAALTKTTYTVQDLLSPTQLEMFANKINERCLELAIAGYTDPHHMLTTLPSFASALGKAINGFKEAQATTEPWVDETDRQIFRTRCLYLFWCADWLLDYMGKPIEGQLMLKKLSKTEVARIRSDIALVARMLLLNWVAWGLFTERIQPGGFWVRRPNVRK